MSLSPALPLDFSAGASYPPFMGEPALTVEDILSEMEQMLPQGSIRAPLSLSYLRDLTEADLLAAERIKPQKQQMTVGKIRASHHSVARMVAIGKPHVEIAATVGYTPSRIYQLLRDPAFQELVSYYRSMTDEVQIDTARRIAGMTNDAMEVLHERLLEAPDKIKTEDLTKIVTLGLDRTGFGPKTTSNINLRAMVVTDAQLDRIKQEALSRRAGQVNSLPTDQGARVGEALPAASPLLLEAKAERFQGEGNFLREEVRENAEEGTALGSGTKERPVDRVP